MSVSPRIIEVDAAKEMCQRIDVPWALGRAILHMVRTAKGMPEHDVTDMVLFAQALKYASDNRHLLKRPLRSHTTNSYSNPFV